MTQIYLGKWFLLQPFWFFLLILNIPFSLRWCFPQKQTILLAQLILRQAAQDTRRVWFIFPNCYSKRDTGVSEGRWMIYRECLHREIKIVFPHSVDISMDKNDAPIKRVYRMFMHVGIVNFHKHKTKKIKTKTFSRDNAWIILSKGGKSFAFLGIIFLLTSSDLILALILVKYYITIFWIFT